MNKQLVFLTIKEANKPVHNNLRRWENRQAVTTHYVSYFQKVKKEFAQPDDADEKIAFNNFCNLCRIDLKFNFKTYLAFEQNMNFQLTD